MIGTNPLEFLLVVSNGFGQPALEEFVPALHQGQTSDRDRTIELKTREFRMVRAARSSSIAQSFWAEEGRSDATPSFVYLLGWCYRIGSTHRSLSAEDFRDMLRRHRGGLPPCDEGLSGTYVAVVYDSETGRIAVQPDRWAMRSIYYAVSGARLVVSSRSVAVASVIGAEIDGHSALSLMRNALHMPLGRSLFAGVHRVLCGCYLAIDTRNRRLALRRAASNFVPVRPGSFSHWAAELQEGLRPLARRLTDCESAVFDLTGGNDTRLLAAMISSENPGSPPNHLAWNVFGPEGDPDVAAARRVAQACHWNLRRLEPVPVADVEAEELIAAAVTSDGTCLVDEAFSRIRLERTQRGDFEWLVGGFAAEHLRGYWWKQEFLRLGRSRVNYQALLDYRIRPSTTIEPKQLGANWPSRREHDQILLDAYERIGSTGKGIVNARMIDVLYMHRLCYSGGNSHSWVTGLREVRLPFMSWEFMSQVLSIPWKLRVGRRMMLRVIEKFNPNLGGIPTEWGGPMRPLGFRTLPLYLKTALKTGALAARVIVRRRVGLLGGRQVVTKIAPPRSWLELVRQPHAVGAIFDPSWIRSLCDAAESGSASTDQQMLFQTLLTLELLLRGVPRLRPTVAFESGPQIPD